MADLCLSIHGRDRTGCDVVVPSTICRWLPLVLGDPRPVVPYQFTLLRRACSLSTSFRRSVATELWKDQIWNRNDPGQSKIELIQVRLLRAALGLQVLRIKGLGTPFFFSSL
ncbi:hypothetical protein U1Q18_026066 [Sarracenia purpurea var. burkii]